MFEVELKFPVPSHDVIDQKLKAFNVISRSTSQHCDEYFNHCLLDFASKDIALRIRSRAGENILTFKGPNLNARVKVRQEIELILDATDRDKFRQMLFGMGFHSVAAVNKKRESIGINVNGQPIEVCFDNVEGVGTFVELEIVVENKTQIDAAKQQLEELAANIGITQSPTTVSYLEMLLSKS